MKTFDKKFVSSILKVGVGSSGKYPITFDSGETEEIQLTKTQYAVVRKHLSQIRPEERTSYEVEEANKASDTRFNSGIQSAKIPEDRKIGKKTWNPAAVTHVSGKQPGYAYRLINTNIAGNVSKKLTEQWEFCTDEQINIPDRTIADGKGLDSTKQIRELVLMRMPNEVAQARREYYESKQISAKDREREIKAGLGSEAYGTITN